MDYPFRIIKKIFENFTEEWCEAKRMDFEKSIYYSNDRLINGEWVIYSRQINEKYDSKDNLISYDLLENEINTTFDLSFSDFLISGDHYYKSVEILAQYHYVHTPLLNDLEAILGRKRPDIEFFAKKLAEKLAHFYNNSINEKATNNFIILIEEKIAEQVDLILDPLYAKEVEYFYDLYFNEFNIKAEKKLSSHRINKIDDVLNFNLNLEDFTALFALIIQSDFIAEDKVKSNNFISFALKHFKIKPDKFNEIFVVLEEDKFSERFGKQLGTSHRLTALDRIIESFKSAYSEIEKQKRKK